MKNQNPNGKTEKINGSESMMNEKSRMMMKEKKRRTRLGGGRGGLSLEAFANAKTKNEHYNPAILKKQREFYKNAKYVNKYKKTLKQLNQQHDPSSSTRSVEDGNEAKKATEKNCGKRKYEKNSAYTLKGVYEKKREEEEKARLEREAQIQAKNEEREKSQSRRKAARDKMLKKTKSGQPVMKYRIEQILQTLQGSQN